MEYIDKVHKVGLPRDYPKTSGNIWFHISTWVYLGTNMCENAKYSIRVDHDPSLNKELDNYNDTLLYYLSLVKNG